jgi:hypothetical protein
VRHARALQTFQLLQQHPPGWKVHVWLVLVGHPISSLIAVGIADEMK